MPCPRQRPPVQLKTVRVMQGSLLVRPPEAAVTSALEQRGRKGKAEH